MTSRTVLPAFALICASVLAVLPASALTLKETPSLAPRVGTDLPPVSERVPQEPLIVDLKARGRQIGTPGGKIDTLIGRSRDVRLIMCGGMLVSLPITRNSNWCRIS